MEAIITQIKDLVNSVRRPDVTDIEIRARLIDIQDLLDQLKKLVPSMKQNELHVYHQFNLSCNMIILQIKHILDKK